MNKEITSLERKILEEVISPSISDLCNSNYYGRLVISEDLNFSDLIRNLKRFYEKNGGHEWNQVLMESDRPKRTRLIDKPFKPYTGIA